MDNNLENNDWKKEAPILAALPIHNPFSAPEGYFDDLSLQITNVVYLEKMKNKVAEPGFNTPENYFDELSQDINTEILTSRLKSISTAQNFTAPANYFEQMQQRILDQTVRKETKVLRLWHSRLLKYASAACLAILCSIGFYFYQHKSAGSKLAYMDMATEQMLYDIDEQVIIDHIEANGLEQAKPSASELAMENYILSNYSQSDIAGNL
ncbi:hypothetical protein [Pedobacter nyackensis]|uniref:Uncharacterized protein n=1 Tax=Pedobacter nyackensis TaxID=475255 RepID=A0A1W2EAH9_9SPHI|nr:hypothetical protein [Pedobacter nyackensis]SMD06783.1 hypothetical protein SAMN04488101_11164 [Pedobacter nyackensis]